MDSNRQPSVKTFSQHEPDIDSHSIHTALQVIQ